MNHQDLEREAPTAQRESKPTGQMASTPIPWEFAVELQGVTGLPLIRSVSGAGICMLYQLSGQPVKANAELIVRAVNNHSRLVEALKGVLTHGEGMTGWANAQDAAYQVLKDLGETPQPH